MSFGLNIKHAAADTTIQYLHNWHSCVDKIIENSWTCQQYNCSLMLRNSFIYLLMCDLFLYIAVERLNVLEYYVYTDWKSNLYFITISKLCGFIICTSATYRFQAGRRSVWCLYVINCYKSVGTVFIMYCIHMYMPVRFDYFMQEYP